jgi:hypothetical protein
MKNHVKVKNTNQGARKSLPTACRQEVKTIAISFIRTVTVGPGIQPDLLTLEPAKASHQALAGSCVDAQIPPVGNFTPP